MRNVHRQAPAQRPAHEQVIESEQPHCRGTGEPPGVHEALDEQFERASVDGHAQALRPRGIEVEVTAQDDERFWPTRSNLEDRFDLRALAELLTDIEMDCVGSPACPVEIERHGYEATPRRLQAILLEGWHQRHARQHGNVAIVPTLFRHPSGISRKEVAQLRQLRGRPDLLEQDDVGFELPQRMRDPWDVSVGKPVVAGRRVQSPDVPAHHAKSRHLHAPTSPITRCHEFGRAWQLQTLRARGKYRRHPDGKLAHVGFCTRGGYLVGASRTLSDDATLFDLDDLAILGCNLVFCFACKAPLKTKIVDAETRVYSCRCGQWKETTEQACNGFDPDDKETAYAGVTLKWRCPGHSRLWLPTSVHGSHVSSHQDLRALVERILRESTDPALVIRLHARLYPDAAEVVARACLDAPDHPISRALFARVPKPRVIPPAPPIYGPPDDPRLERALEDLVFRETLADSYEPIGRYLRAIGAFAHEWMDEIDYTDWNGAIVGRGPGSVTRNAIPPDPKLELLALVPLLKMGPCAREIVAKHPVTPNELLVGLAEDDSFDVKKAVLERKNRSLEIDLRLARCPRGIAEPLARDSALSPEVMEVLARHPSREVKAALLQRHDLPAGALAILSLDPEEWVRSAAAAKT